MKDADNYLFSILERSSMYAGPSIQTLEAVLINLLNYRALVLEVDVGTTEILRKSYFEHFGHSAGASGPSSRFIEKYGEINDDVMEFYTAFVEEVMEAQDEAAKEKDHRAAMKVEEILIANIYSRGPRAVAKYVNREAEGNALLSDLVDAAIDTENLDLKFLGAWPHGCPHCGIDWCDVNEPPQCWWDYDGKCSECGKHPYTASPQALERAGGFLPGAPKFEKEPEKLGAECSACGGFEREGCPICGGSGRVNGTLPTEPGWYMIMYREGREGLVRVNDDMEALRVSRKGNVAVGEVNWDEFVNEPIVAWGPKLPPLSELRQLAFNDPPIKSEKVNRH